MASIINTSTTLGGIATEGDSSNELKIQTDGTDAISIDGSQVVTFAAPIVFPAGTASTPAITTTGDTNTGIFFPGADRIGFAEGGAQCGEFDASGNFQFNSGYGSVATAYGCRAWVNFNGAGTLTGTYSQSGTTITVTITSHGLSQGKSVYITFQSGTASAEAFTVTSVTNANVFVVTSATSRTTSGNCTLATVIRASGNVSSITDNGTGDYTVNFTTAMPDANYAIVTTGQRNSAGGITDTGIYGGAASTLTTSTARISTLNGAATATEDLPVVCVAIFR